MDPKPRNPEEDFTELRMVKDSFMRWHESKNSGEGILITSFQEAVDKLEALIHANNASDGKKILLIVGEEELATKALVGSFGDGVDIRESREPPLQPDETLSIETTRSFLQFGLPYECGRRTVYVGDFHRSIEAGDLAEALANGAELVFEEQEPSVETVIRAQWEQVVMPYVKDELRELAESTIDKIIELYSYENRQYHNLDHILYCLQQLEAYKDRDDFLQLWLALLLHDIVYDTQYDKNEEDSGAFAQYVSDILELEVGDDVDRLVVSTKKHDSEVEDEALICSIDMSILASDPETYDDYSKAIRAEYSWVPKEIYIPERIKILKSFFKAFTHPDFEHLNEKAHENIVREISWLSTL